VPLVVQDDWRRPDLDAWATRVIDTLQAMG